MKDSVVLTEPCVPPSTFNVTSVDVSFDISVGGADVLKIEEMEKMLKEAQLEKARLIESRVRQDPVTDEGFCCLLANMSMTNEG